MGNKKIGISLPETLLSDVDALAGVQGVCRSEWIRTALSEAVFGQGYRTVGEINLRLSEEGASADNEQFLSYEQTLSECE